MKAAGDLVTFVGKFRPGVKPRQGHLRSGNPLRLVDIHRDSPAVVIDDNAIVYPDIYHDGIAETGGRLVNAVVHNLINQMVEPFLPCAPDIHGRTLPDCFQPFQYLNAVSTVTFCCFSTFYKFVIYFHLSSQKNRDGY